VPPLTRWFVKAGLLYLLSALLLAVAMQWPGAAARVPWLAVVWPTYLHLLVVGWLTQLIFGVALWLFPRHSAARPRGYEWLGWTSFILLNTGLLIRVVAEPRAALGQDVGLLLLISATAQLLAGWAFVANVWPRVRER
jgi:hypothetical protein